MLLVTISLKSADRALRIFDAFTKYLYQNGHRIEIDTRCASRTQVIYDGIKIGVYLKELYDVQPHVLTPNEQKKGYQWSIPIRDYFPNSKLEFAICNHGYVGTVWKDKWKIRLEDCLPQIIDKLAELAAREKEVEERRIAEEKKRREETARIETERKIIENIPYQVDSWVLSSRIRAYLEALKSAALQKHGKIDDGSELDLLLKCGFAYADRIDPVSKKVG